MKHFLQQDSATSGLVAGIGLIACTALLLTVGLLVAGEPVGDHLRWYAACFVAPLLLMRSHLKQQRATAAKALMVLLFVTFVAFMFLLFTTHSIDLK